MPTYEYTCDRCGERIEVVQSFTDKPLRKHKGCGGALQKVFHASGVVFKGSGFYVTDSRKSSSSNGTSDSKSSSSSSSSSTSSSSTPSTSKDSKASTTETSQD